MEETRADECLPWFKQRVRQPPNQLRLFREHSEVLSRLQTAGSEVCGRTLTTEDFL